MILSFGVSSVINSVTDPKSSLKDKKSIPGPLVTLELISLINSISLGKSLIFSLIII